MNNRKCKAWFERVERGRVLAMVKPQEGMDYKQFMQMVKGKKQAGEKKEETGKEGKEGKEEEKEERKE